MKRICSILLLTTLSAASSVAQTAGYKAQISQLDKNIYTVFYDKPTGLYLETNNVAENKGQHSYLWPLTALLQAANEQESLAPGKQHIAQVMKAINQYYSGRAPAPGYQAMVVKEKADTRFYDDNEWIAIALMDAYNRTHNQQYLETSKLIYRFLLTGYDEATGGGFYWEEGNLKSKNTCSNGPAILVALRLYQATKQQNYLDTAIKVYSWTKRNLLSPTGVYFDNIRVPSLKIDSALYTYNAGTMMQSAVLLYNITRNNAYLTDAINLANASEKQFYRNGKLPDNYWFNAVLLRGYLELYKVDKNKQRLQFFINDANRIWKEEKDDRGFVGRKSVKTLIDQSAMLEIYARLQELQLEK
ncbi:glycoside hydrolase family 76 protein [Mucilaginibacter sp.]|uniref:glycoside hydrolase family 76 protein n=1 Tax=Mucilaginibacter sp. TaxID=1882438 RepID=UPI0035BC29C8